MKNHLPIYITPPGTGGKMNDKWEKRPDRLLFPDTPPASCPLVVIIEDETACTREAEALKDQGYAVFCREADRRMERDRESCLLWQRELEEKLAALFDEYPCLDRNRVFLDGWMSAFLVFHSHGFRAAVQRPALLDRASAYGSCPAGWVEPFGGSLMEMLCTLAKQSVIADADSCKTPLLVLYQPDPRYTPEQSEILYSIMKDRNPDVPCRLAVFPETAAPERVLREVTDWWKRFSQEVPNG